MCRFFLIFGRLFLKILQLKAVPFVASAALVATPIAAQNLPPQIQQQMLGGAVSRGGGSFGQSADDTNSSVLIQPASRPQSLPRSDIEKILSSRAGVPLNQFGYKEMGVARPVLLPQSGGMQENYVLGPGDEIVVTMRGQEAGEFRTLVDRNGRVILPKLSPINVAGRTFSVFQQDLTSAVQRAYVATEAFVALGRVRQIRVTVGGEVNNPGLRILTGLASAVDAIFVSDGVKKTGSLRNIQILRGGQRIQVDLYSILRGTAGAQAPLLTDGDRLIVSPLGATAAIVGPVRIPGIYELAPGQPGMTAASLIAMAGGYTVRGRYNLALIGLAADGRTQLSDIPNDRTLVRDSDILIVRSTAEQTVGRATFQVGSDSAFSGNYATQSTRLSEMLRSPGILGDDPYPLFAIISRRDPTTLLRTLVAVTPAAILAGRQDFTLQSDDIVHTFARTEAFDLIKAINWFDVRYKNLNDETVPFLAAPEDFVSNSTVQPSPHLVPKPRLGKRANSSNVNTGYDLRANYNSGFDNNTPNQVVMRESENDPRLSDAPKSEMPVGETSPETSIDQSQQAVQVPETRYLIELRHVKRVADLLKVEPAILTKFLLDYQVILGGAVRGSGNYFVGPDLPLGTLLQAAGGTLNQSDKTGVERVSTVVDAVTGQTRTATQILDLSKAQFATTMVRPRDQYRVPYSAVEMIGSVLLKGEVRRPGSYSITRGERLSDVLTRAGGLTSTAYPYGAVFLRKSVQLREKEGLDRAAKYLESQLTVALTRTSNSSSVINPGLNYEAIVNLASDIRNAPVSGRVSVLADPAVLATKPASDTILEGGDSLYIPQRPVEVTVIGEVMNSGSFRSDPNMSIFDYIDRAGGYGESADKSLVYAVLPDGTSRKVARSLFAMDSERLPPGSVIVVPRDLSPFNFRQTAVDITQILGQVAISLASLTILSRE
jgi:protein involved in polysaccharide export with SLBB domain